MMKSALVARARAPARSRHLSKIPLAHVVPHRVGVELPGTLERSSWAVEPWNVRGFCRDFPTTGFLRGTGPISLRENRVFIENCGSLGFEMG